MSTSDRSRRTARTAGGAPVAPLGALLLACALPLAGCWSGGSSTPPPPPPADYLPMETAAVAAPLQVGYVDVTADSGLRFVHETGAFGKKFLPETMGSGVCILDHDSDGRPDILLVNGRRWPGHDGDYPGGPRPPAILALYRNLGGIRFEDVTEKAGLAVSVMGMGATAADLDDDGDPDLFITAVGEQLLFRNDGGRFTDITKEAGLTAPTWTDPQGRAHGPWSTSCAFLDFDGDGSLDLFVAHYVRWSEETDIFTTLDGTHKAYTTPELYPGDSCRLYRNLGALRFEDVTEKAGILHPEGKSLGVAIADCDGDGWPDILVSNDTQPNFLFHNRRDGTFMEMGLTAGIAFSPEGRARAGMGIDALRDRNTPSLAIAVGNFSREPVSLYREIAKDFFQDDGAAAGIATPTLPSLTFGILFLDYDLDGLPDLCLANGHIEPTIQEVQKDISYAQRPQLLRNLGGGPYGEVPGAPGAEGAFFAQALVARGLAAADLDGDGDLDLVLTRNGGPAVVLRCDSRTANRSIRLRLRGARKNLDALGARVRLTAAGIPQERMVRTGSSYLSQSELTLTFGIGTSPAADGVEILWPDKTEESFRNVPAGAEYVVSEGAGMASGEQRIPGIGKGTR